MLALGYLALAGILLILTDRTAKGKAVL